MSNEQKSTTATTNVFSKPALVTDLNDSYISHEQYSHARNATRNSKEGDLGTIGNEPSTVKCYSAPYTIIGVIPMPDDKDLVMSTNNIKSEIGVGNRMDCSYSTLKNMDCLGFNTNFPIMGVVKKHSKKGLIATFTDKNMPPRRIELKKLPSINNCDDIRLFKKIDQPCITVTKGTVGNIPNGSYSVAMAYSVDGQMFSDVFSITNRILLYNETGSNSLEVNISKLDKDFEKFTLILVGNYIDPTTKGVTKTAKVVGEYSTNTKRISLTDFINTTYKEIPLETLVIKKKTWDKVGIISSNSNYLLLGDLVSKQEEDYQLKAMGIETEYVVTQLEADYYRNDGEDIGYYRDENYDFSIVGVYNTGEHTERFHIPGRKATPADRSLVASADVYEYDNQFKDCSEPGRIQKWQVENTAGKMIPYNEEFKCGRRLLGRGKMGYNESTEVYENNKEMFGEDAGTPIRTPRMPDESIVPRYQNINGKQYINILGVRFKNIPKFDNPDIVGYKIIRSDRKGGNGTIVARGIMTNVRSYKDEQVDQRIMYSNYGLNDLSPDQFISSKQTVFKNNKEHNFVPLVDYHKDRFTFYSPHTSFEPRYSLGNEIKIEAEEVADVKGRFEIVFNHPKLKLLNQFSFWLALAIGTVETYFEAQGLKNQTTITSSGGIKGNAMIHGVAEGTIQWDQDGPGPLGTKTNSSGTIKGGGSALSITGTAVQESFQTLMQMIQSGNFSEIATYVKILKTILKLITTLGIGAGLTAVSIMRYATETLNIISNFTGYTDYVYQYNAHASFNRTLSVPTGNKRRRLLKPHIYLPSTVVTVEDEIFNNAFREKSVYLHLNKEVKDPTTKDTTRNTITGFGIKDNPKKEVKSTGSAYYVTSKVTNPNQYGPLGSSSSVSMHSCVIPFSGDTSESPVLFGGDCIITKFHAQKRMQFFNQNIANIKAPNGIEYDYRLYRNLGYPRFWLDSTQYDYSELLNKKNINFATFNRTTANKHNLDGKKKNDGKSPSRIDDAYMYLSNNCAMEFFVEADYNIDFREKTQEPFFSKENTNLSQIFRSDRLNTPEEFKISRAYSDLYTTEIFAPQQRMDFSPKDRLPTDQPNAVVYSLPAFNLQDIDNWQYFLPANYFSFSESDFGNLTGIHKLDQDRIIFMFSGSSPYVLMGRDMLELTSGRKITIGDAGLFAQDPREIMPTDTNYGASNSRFAFANTEFGRFYPSTNRIFNFKEGLDPISEQGISFWCKNYMPIFLYQYFPEYPKVENPVSGVGYLTAFDSTYETVYFTKRDFSPKKEYLKDITYNKEKKSFYFRDFPVSVRDTRYFNDISWTLSYSALDKSFVGWHDWHPDLTIQADNHFLSVKGNTVWKHNEAFDSFCKFYGTQYPFEIEFLSTSGQQIETIRNLEYFLEVYKYKNFGRDRFHVLNENFDRLLVRNSEQMSPLLNLILAPDNPLDRLYFPKKNTTNKVSYDIMFEKVEQKYRVNQFWDSVKNRDAEVHLFPVDESGYKRVVNPLVIDIDKPEVERKRFRHYWNKFLFIKTDCGENKFLTKIANVKKLISPR